MTDKIKVHIVMNSHLDPIWLWNLDQGVDEIIATARTACDLLDDYPDLHLIRGESMFYETVERLDPATFQRMKQHIANNRLHVVGGWYVQPDCNLASAETYRRHAEIGCRYFKEKFGIEQIKTGFNIDSFGHSSYLPDFYRNAGMINYVMLRPSTGEMQLPCNVFRWQSPSGTEILTTRVMGSYNSTARSIVALVTNIARECDRHLKHVMVCCGVGNHGAGPEREEIDLLKSQWNNIEGAELVFDHPDNYFDEIREEIRRSNIELPVIKEELKHHAIGCYSAYRAIKKDVAETENRLVQAEKYLTETESETAWKQLLFATFHDVLAGTAIRSAYGRIHDSLGLAKTLAVNAVSDAIRKRNVAELAPDPMQRLILDNTGRETYDSLIGFEPWITWRYIANLKDIVNGRLLDEDGNEVPFQKIQSESATDRGEAEMIFPVKLAAGERKIFRLDLTGNTPKTETAPIRNVENKDLDSLIFRNTEYLAEPIKFVSREDTTDTWSHKINSFPESTETVFAKEPFREHFSGPFVCEDLGSYHADGGKIDLAVRKSADCNGLRLRLRLTWNLAQTQVRMVMKPSFPVKQRIEETPGGKITRSLNGEEYPLFRAIKLQGEEHSLSVVTDDCFSTCVKEDGTLELMLIRTPYYAHHEPYIPPENHFYPVTDLGFHEFEITILCDADDEDLRREIYRQTDPVRISESTFGVNRELQ